ncbi:hypothetical protein MMC14_004192 [Varicellaria rhodocarpa]|nr:hypothetical protein [Varicellaria rhodocarpa]
MADLSRTLTLQRSSVQSAHELIKPYIHETPVLTCKTLNNLASTPQSKEALIGTPFEGHTPARPKIHFFFKCENYQRIGAFKSRGAFHALSRLTDQELKNGVVTHSSGILFQSHCAITIFILANLLSSFQTGNHAQALALAARTRGVHAYIVMPTISTPSKIAATQGYGAEVIFSGSTSEEREAVVGDVIKRTGAILVPPYDHPDIILGQGTLALELEKQVKEMVKRDPDLSIHKPSSSSSSNDPSHLSNGHHVRPRKPHEPGHLDAVIAPCGGGGMLSGIATALSTTGTRVFGAEPSFSGADDARRGLLSGTRILSVNTLTIADGLRTPLGEIPWSVLTDKEQFHGMYAVTERQIRGAMRLVLERMKVFVEPSAVVGLAVGLWDEGFRGVVEREGGEGEGEGWDVGVVLSGGNTTVEAILGIFGGEGAERAEGKVGMGGERVAENVAG